MAELPNTIAMDDVESDDDNDNVNNNDSNDVRGYLIRIDVNGNAVNTFILTKETTSIGRKKSNDIILIDATVSSNHAEIEIDISDHTAYVVDLKSTNKTRIGKEIPSKDNQNKKLKPNRQSIVKSGEYVTFGGIVIYKTRFIFCFSIDQFDYFLI